MSGRRALLAGLAGVAVCAAPVGAVGAPAGTTAPTAFVIHAQNRDGGFGGAPGQASSPLFTAWAVLGLAAAGRDPATIKNGGPSAAAAVKADAGRVTGLGDIERTLLALRAAAIKPAPALVRRMLTHVRADGSFDGLGNLTAFGVLALRAAGRSTSDARIRAAAAWLAARQHRDGGFSFGGADGPEGIDDTGAIIEALVAAGRRTSDTRVKRAAKYLTSHPNPDGGYGTRPGTPSNAQSTAWAAQGLVAAGADPGYTPRGSRSPLAYLRSLVAPGGDVRYSRSGRQTPVWVTAQALTALARRPFPIAPVHS